MKLLNFYVIAMLCTGILACSKDKGPDNPDSGLPDTPDVTAAGVPDGTPVVQKVIGAAGGSLVSQDGGMTVTVPAGAFKTDQTVKIQRITSTNPLGNAQGYRIEPHGITFEKPVTLTINAGDSLLSGTFKNAVGIAYRNDKGIWMAMPKAVVNEAQKTVSVQTTHFSDWEFFQRVKIEIDETLLYMGETATLRVVSDDKIFNDPVDSEEPLSNATVPASMIKSWTMSSKYGTLVPKGAEAIYGSPLFLASKPHNPIAINAELNGPGNTKYLLTQGLVVSAGHMEFNVGGGSLQGVLATPVTKIGNQWALVDHNGDETGIRAGVYWSGGVGTHVFEEPTAEGNRATFTVNGQAYVSYYIDPADDTNTPRPSPGNITITSMDDKGFVRGTFVLEKAGRGNNLKSFVRITGSFRVQKQP